MKFNSNADIFAVIGTSLKVSPALYFIRCPHHSVLKFIINLGDPPGPYDDNYPDCYGYIQERATKGVETLIDRLIKLS